MLVVSGSIPYGQLYVNESQSDNIPAKTMILAWKQLSDIILAALPYRSFKQYTSQLTVYDFPESKLF